MLTARAATAWLRGRFLELLLVKMSEKDTKEDAMRAFRQFDIDHQGRISFANLQAVARELGETMTDEEISEMITAADLDKDVRRHTRARAPSRTHPRAHACPRALVSARRLLATLVWRAVCRVSSTRRISCAY